MDVGLLCKLANTAIETAQSTFIRKAKLLHPWNGKSILTDRFSIMDLRKKLKPHQRIFFRNDSRKATMVTCIIITLRGGQSKER